MHTCGYAYIYIHISLYILAAWLFLGTKYCTPAVDALEVIVHFQWHVPVNCQCHLPTEFNCSVVLSKGLSLSLWVSLGLSNGFSEHFPMETHLCDFWCVIVCPDF